jgi:23S rRNA pseudouridine2605 synthase
MSEPGKVRLHKFLADAGVASRREAERMIAEGRVEVNGQAATVGQAVDPAVCHVRVDGRAIRPPSSSDRKVLILNKPRGVVCTHRDPNLGDTPTIYDMLPPPLRSQRWICVGRLDKESEGLVLLTNDGALAQRLMHPSSGVIKKYMVELTSGFDPADRVRLIQGVTWEDELLKVERVIPRKNARNAERALLEVHLQHGKKREIRNLLFAIGYRVRRLRRIQIGPVRIDGLPAGAWRPLTATELSGWAAVPPATASRHATDRR